MPTNHEGTYHRRLTERRIDKHFMTRNHQAAPPKPDTPGDRPQTPEVRRWALSDLLGDAREAIIEHGSETYRLRLTSNKKLILTK